MCNMSEWNIAFGILNQRQLKIVSNMIPCNDYNIGLRPKKPETKSFKKKPI